LTSTTAAGGAAGAAPTATSAVGYLYITQAYIGIYFRQGVLLNAAITKELYLLQDLQEVKLINKSIKASPGAAPGGGDLETSNSFNDEGDSSFPSSSATPTAAAATASTSTTMFSSFQQSLGLNHLSFECNLLFKTTATTAAAAGGHQEEEERYHLVTITPALISADKLYSVLLEVKEMSHGIPAGP
jgi:hypothetical protein